jgi:valyl-tRNA synthetase
MLEKHFKPQDIEQDMYEQWESSGAFKSGQRPDADPYCIVMPPPNVTGSLHVGHALDMSIQDILCRYQRLKGKDVLWQPGTDHAGIATQMVVERQLAEAKQPTRWQMGREKFVERVWQWKEESGGTITRQLRRLGASCDWSRERFTMDEGLSAAVRKVFIQLHKEGLIYKDMRLVNWDPKLLTAISDLEVVPTEQEGNLWHFKYPLEGEAGKFITVATTRPETMLGDTGVAVHPDDERYQDLIGKNIVLPLVGRRIPIVADTYADPEQGSGAVKITPAHDFNDFEVGKRCGLAKINILDMHAKIDIEANEGFLEGLAESHELAETMKLHGVDRFEARKTIVERFKAAGLLDKIETHEHKVPYGDRSNVVIEPWLTPQWYVDAQVLARPAIKAVEDGTTKFVPENWSKTYFEWMRNIQPWCISRQLWWGHQIPAWYGPDEEIFVAENEAEARAAAKDHYGKDVELRRDEDVLDTWFSSALWAFSTLGWPENTRELEKFYPTSVLVTGLDIIFFWVARMMMFGMHFMKDEDGKAQVPFETVYIHALVRDEHGQKMSKSKGNVIDPIELVDEYGADAVRFTMAAMAGQGRDIKLAVSRIEGYRNFGTKLWNAARFCEMNECFGLADFDPAAARLPLNRAIIAKSAIVADKVAVALDEHRYNDGANALYAFVWNNFCDWHLELIKPVLFGQDEAAKLETRQAATFVLEQIIIMLHPFMPFITEELWQHTAGNGNKRDGWLMNESWPQFDGLQDDDANAEVDWLIDFISQIRSVRAEMNVPAGAKVPCVLVGANAENRRLADQWEVEASRLARLESLEIADQVPDGAAQIVFGQATIAMPLKGVIDFDAEKQRLAKELDKIAKEIKSIEGRLANQGFVAKAPANVIEETRQKLADLKVTEQKTIEAGERLKSVS